MRVRANLVGGGAPSRVQGDDEPKLELRKRGLEGKVTEQGANCRLRLLWAASCSGGARQYASTPEDKWHSLLPSPAGLTYPFLLPSLGQRARRRLTGVPFPSFSASAAGVAARGQPPARLCSH